MEILAQFGVSPLSVFSYGAMLVLLAETLGLSWRAAVSVRSANRLQRIIKDQEGFHGFGCAEELITMQAEIRARLVRDHYAMSYLETLAPVAGLGFSMLAIVVAVPDIMNALSTDPDAFFAKFGIGAGTSLLGVVGLAIAFSSRFLVEGAMDRLDRSAAPTETPGQGQAAAEAGTEARSLGWSGQSKGPQVWTRPKSNFARGELTASGPTTIPAEPQRQPRDGELEEI